MTINIDYEFELDLHIKQKMRWFFGTHSYKPATQDPLKINFKKRPTAPFGNIVFKNSSGKLIKYTITQYNPFDKELTSETYSIRTYEFVATLDEAPDDEEAYKKIYMNVKVWINDNTYPCGGSGCNVMYDFHNFSDTNEDSSTIQGGGTGGSMRNGR